MAKEISFKDLPFVPVEGQVIYVEQSYNDKLNKFIRNNYEWLKATFRNQGLEFCFLKNPLHTMHHILGQKKLIIR